MPNPSLELQPRLRFPRNAPDAFGPGKAELLKLIAETGSIRSAAKQMAMSYNCAWGLVRDMNALFHDPLVVRTRGGKTGGGATLSETGKDVLARYTKMEQACQLATRADWNALRRLLR